MESGVGGKTYNIIKSMFTNNKCAVKIGEEFPKQAGPGALFTNTPHSAPGQQHN